MRVRYCNHSRRAFMYQYLLLNVDRYEVFDDDLYNDIMNKIKKSGNEDLIDKVDDTLLYKEANDLYEKVNYGL